MNVESHIYGYSDWRLPSPSSTPKAPCLASPSLKTPKSAGSPSYFLDAFSTPRPNGQTTPAQTPVFGTFTVVERPASPRPRRQTRPEDPEFHVNCSSTTPNLQLPPVSPSRRLSSSPNLSTSPSDTSEEVRSTVPGVPQASSNVPMDPYQMQTPPPTRDATSRRKMPPPQMGVVHTPAAVAPRPVQTTPLHTVQVQPPQSLNIQTPYQYNPLQFSPENFQFPGSGPASAPAYPHARLFWDSSPQSAVGMDMSSQHDPFGPGSQAAQNMHMWPSFEHQARAQQQMAFNSTPIQPQQQHPPQPNPNFWSPGDVIPQDTVPFTSPVNPSTITGANPNMFVSYSSPAGARPSTTVQPQHTQVTHAQGGRQPYEHQMQESIREQESARKARQQHARTDTGSSLTSLPMTAKPGLQRSNTDSGFRRRHNLSTDSRLSAQSIEANIARKASPLKRLSQGQVLLSAIPETARPRPRTRLVIDENGRARTETMPADEEIDSRRRSGLWAEIDSGSDSEAEDTVPSQRSSFIFTSDPLRRSKHARIDSNAEPTKVARSSSSGSLNNAVFGIRRSASSSSRRGNIKVDPRRFSVASFGSGPFVAEGPEKPIEMEGVEEGDAQLALKKVVEDRLKRQSQEQSPEAILKAHNQRWSLASADVAKLQPFTFDAPQQQATLNQHQISSHQGYNQNVSPIAFADQDNVITPMTDRTSLSHESVRCVCQSGYDDGTQMIQCESCMKWLHVRCVGFNSQHLPQVYVCVFCTGTTPLVRGGRVREPVRAVPQSHQNFASPLAGRGNNPFR